MSTSGADRARAIRSVVHMLGAGLLVALAAAALAMLLAALMPGSRESFIRVWWR